MGEINITLLPPNPPIQIQLMPVSAGIDMSVNSNAIMIPGPKGDIGPTKKFITATSAPTQADGTDGDIWFQYRL